MGLTDSRSEYPAFDSDAQIRGTGKAGPSHEALNRLQAPCGNALQSRTLRFWNEGLAGSKA